jgi:ribonucleoside-triphosphate reductase
LKGETRLRPIDVYDIAMHAADAVLAGGVRRSATICLFSPDDEEMAKAKTGNWFADNPQRGRSNNSAVIVRDEVTREQFSELMESIKQFGEPGFYFVDDKDFTTNPCVEIGMYPQIKGKSGWQGCNLD